MQVVGLYKGVFCKMLDAIKEYFASCGTVSKRIMQVVGLYQKVLRKL
jgi:hypothetical protein